MIVVAICLVKNSRSAVRVEDGLNVERVDPADSYGAALV